MKPLLIFKALFLFLFVFLAWLSSLVSAFGVQVPTTCTTSIGKLQTTSSRLFSNKDTRQSSSSSSSADAASNTNVIRPLQLDYVDQNSHWVYMFYLLMVYRTREGHVHVPCRHVESGWPLGYWLVDQRVLYRKGVLDPERQQRLEEDAGISWNLFQGRFEIMCECLREFIQYHGHANVPQHYVVTNTTYGDLKLGIWLNSQRRLYKQGALEPTRKHQLESMGVVWNAQEAKWNTMYQCLQDFVETEKHAQVPISYTTTSTAGVETQLKLGTWLNSQRKFWRNGTLSKDRQEKLKALGVCPDVMDGLKNSSNKTKSRSKGRSTTNNKKYSRVSWNDMYKKLENFVKREQHTYVPKHHNNVKGEEKLGIWLCNQRYFWRTGKLRTNRIAKLEALGVSPDRFQGGKKS